jgi:hypothetical protein
MNGLTLQCSKKKVIKFLNKIFKPELQIKDIVFIDEDK